MAFQLDTIREAADRVASSFGLEVVDVEFTGGARHRNLRVFLEKNAAGRAALAAAATAAAETGEPVELPRGIPVEHLSGLTHEDCAHFAQDFGTMLDVEELVPGAEYTLEVSSPGVERKLLKAADYERFTGSLVKLQTFTPVNNNRHFSGRLDKFEAGTLTLDASVAKQRPKKGAAKPAAQIVEIALANVEKAHLLAEL